MNQKGFVTPIIIVVVIVAALGAVFYLVARNKSEEAGQTSQQSEQAEDNKSDSVTGKVTDLFLAGRNLTCTFSDEGNDGVVFIEGAQKRMRGDFITQVDGTPTSGHIINTGTHIYTWSDSESQGVRFPVPDASQGMSDAQMPNTPASNNLLEADYDYDCDSWSVDQSKFSLPPNIEFIDMSEQFQQLQTQGLNCSVCDQMEGPAKAQCLQSLGC